MADSNARSNPPTGAYRSDIAAGHRPDSDARPDPDAWSDSNAGSDPDTWSNSNAGPDSNARSDSHAGSDPAAGSDIAAGYRSDQPDPFDPSDSAADSAANPDTDPATDREIALCRSEGKS